MFDPSDGTTQSFPAVAGSSQLLLTAELGGGDGDAAWQHSQLFRESLEQTEERSLEVQIHLED